MKLCAMILVALALCACGDVVTGNTPGNDLNPANRAEGYGDEHGKTTEVGEKEMGEGYKVSLFRVQSELKSEAIYEAIVQKDGKALPGANVTAWLGDEKAFEFTPVAPCLWMDDRNAYDCHVMLPPDGAPENARVWIRVRHEDKDVKTDFPFTQ